MQSHGSARVRFAEGGTDVITSVRVETANYSEVMDPRDQIDVSLVFTASSSPSFLTRERSVEGELIAESIRKSAFLLSLTDRVLTSPGVMDLDELIIVKGLLTLIFRSMETAVTCSTWLCFLSLPRCV